MAENSGQDLGYHVRWDPPFHFFVLPVILISFIGAIWHAVVRPGIHSLWLVIFVLALAVLAVKSRMYALRVQDRVIRLEERLRLATLCQEPLRSRIGELTEAQLIALRFAPDAEVAVLADKALAGKLSAAEIKKLIQNWRGDYWRV